MFALLDLFRSCARLQAGSAGLWLLAVISLLGAGCAEDLCKSRGPAFELQLSLDEPSLAAQLSSLRVDITAAGLHKVEEVDSSKLQSSGRATLAVVVGKAGQEGFKAQLKVELLDQGGQVLFTASDSFDGSGDACNFFSMTLQLPRSDGSVHDLGPAGDSVEFIDLGGTTCGPDTCLGCCLPDGRCAGGTTDSVCGSEGGSCVSCADSGGVCSDQSCCTPDCEGKDCGADDGCGGLCQSGDCPAGQACVSGSCRCTAQSCSSGCCAADERCMAGTTDGACGKGGAACSNCSATGETCQNQSCTCVPDCPADKCNISDGCSGTCQCGSNQYCNNTTCEPLLCQLCTDTGDCQSQCVAWGSTGGSCSNPGSTNPADCCLCNDIASGNNPIGFLDEITSSGVARGWSCDQDNPWQSIWVHIYIGGPAGTGDGPHVVKADDDNGDLVTQFCGGGAYHRFNYSIPSYQSKSGQPVYAYGINIAGGVNVVLQQCPKYIP